MDIIPTDFKNNSRKNTVFVLCKRVAQSSHIQFVLEHGKTSCPSECVAEQHYLLSAVAGRRQEDRASIRPPNKVKRLPSIRDFIPVHVNSPNNPAGRWVAKMETWAKAGHSGQTPFFKISSQHLVAVSWLMELIATARRLARLLSHVS